MPDAANDQSETTATVTPLPKTARRKTAAEKAGRGAPAAKKATATAAKKATKKAAKKDTKKRSAPAAKKATDAPPPRRGRTPSTVSKEGTKVDAFTGEELPVTAFPTVKRKDGVVRGDVARKNLPAWREAKRSKKDADAAATADG